MKTASYIRANVSKDQKAKVAGQILICTRWINVQGDDRAGVYVDDGVDGMEANRPALDQLFMDALAGKFDRVILAHPSVLARGAQTYDALRKRFEDADLPLSFAEPEQAVLPINLDALGKLSGFKDRTERQPR